MTMQHGTQPTTKKSKPFSDDHLERKRGIKKNLPPRDGTTRTEGVSLKHRKEDKNKIAKENRYLNEKKI